MNNTTGIFQIRLLIWSLHKA